MAQIKTLNDLRALRKVASERMDTRIKGNKAGLPQIRVAMATAGIAAGAKEIFDYLIEQSDNRGLEVVVLQTGVIAEGNNTPVVVELALADGETKVFENVDKKMADQILDSLKG